MTPEQLRAEYEMEEMLFGKDNPLLDEIEHEDCILCCEGHNIENMQVVNGAWVCNLCIQDNRAENISTYKMVLDAQQRLAERKSRIEAASLDMKKNFWPTLKVITDSYKRKVHA